PARGADGDAAVPPGAGSRRLDGLAALRDRFPARRRVSCCTPSAANRRLAADELFTPHLRLIPRSALARRRQRKPLGLGSARLCLRARLLCRRTILDCRSAVRRYRRVLVGAALRAARRARAAGVFYGCGIAGNGSWISAAAAVGERAGVPVRGGLVRGRMGARPRPDRSPLEPGRLCLVRRLSRSAGGTPDHRLGRYLWAEPSDGARRRAAVSARDALTLSYSRAAAGRAGNRGGALDPGPRRCRRDPAASVAVGLDRDLAAPGSTVDLGKAEMGPGRRGTEPSAAHEIECRPVEPCSRCNPVARGG